MERRRQQKLSRCGQLNLLQEEIRQLFDRGCEESEMANILLNDQRFDYIRRSTIRSIHKWLIKKKNAPKNKKEKKEEAELLDRYYSNTDRRLYFTGPIKFLGKATYELRHLTCKWNDRYFFLLNRTFPTTEEDAVHRLYLFDLYDNKTRIMTYPKSRQHFGTIIQLNGNYGLVFESNEPYAKSQHFCVTLVYFDSINRNIEPLHNYECPLHLPKLMIDSSDPNKFAIRWIDKSQGQIIRKFIQTASWKSSGIEFGKPTLLDHQMFWNVGSYYKDKIYSFSFGMIRRDGNSRIDNGTIHVYDMKRHSIKQVRVSPTGRDFQVAEPSLHNCKTVWITDRLYTVTRFPDSNTFGLAWTACDSPFWTSINFAVKFPIESMTFVNNSDLIIQVDGVKTSTSASRHNTTQFYYKIPYRGADFLFNLAWSRVVQTFTKNRVADPYQKALKYRPKNFDKTLQMLNQRAYPDY